MRLRRGSWGKIDLQSALLPLYVVSKVCCLNAFDYRPPKSKPKPRGPGGAPGNFNNAPINRANGPWIISVDRSGPGLYPNRSHASADEPATSRVLTFSIIGIVHAASCSLGYSAYHVVSSLQQSSKLTDTNLVRVAIDLKNQYVGCLLVLALVTVSVIRQPVQGRLIGTLLQIDEANEWLLAGLPGPRLSSVNNAAWLRNILVMLISGVGVKAVLEVTNCLMYIRDSGSPFSSYCLLLCIVPQTLCVVCELQYVAFALLIRDRFALLSRMLLRLQPHLLRGDGQAFGLMRRITAGHVQLTRAIQLLNESFGVQNAILLLFQFVTLVELGYNACMMVVRYDDDDPKVSHGDSMEDFAETVLWVGWFLLEIFVFCYFSHILIDEARETNNRLKLPAVYSLTQTDHFRLVSYEQIRMINERLGCSCAGLFVVDLSLLFAIIAATTTYLIILIQFDQSFNESS